MHRNRRRPAYKMICILYWVHAARARTNSNQRNTNNNKPPAAAAVGTQVSLFIGFACLPFQINRASGMRLRVASIRAHSMFVRCFSWRLNKTENKIEKLTKEEIVLMLASKYVRNAHWQCKICYVYFFSSAKGVCHTFTATAIVVVTAANLICDGRAQTHSNSWAQTEWVSGDWRKIATHANDACTNDAQSQRKRDR